MDTKMAVAIANIFIAKVETEILNQSTLTPLVWKRFIFYLWDTTSEEITQFVLDTTIYKFKRFKTESVSTHSNISVHPFFILPSIRSEKKKASLEERL